MGTFSVVDLDEVVEPVLLLEEVRRRRPGCFQLQGEMHAFVTAVLLRVAGLDAFDLDAQPPNTPTESGNNFGSARRSTTTYATSEEFKKPMSVSESDQIRSFQAQGRLCCLSTQVSLAARVSNRRVTVCGPKGSGEIQTSELAQHAIDRVMNHHRAVWV